MVGNIICRGITEFEIDARQVNQIVTLPHSK